MNPDNTNITSEEPLSRNISLTIAGVDYSFSFPTMGQFIAIENEKHRLSNGTYKNYSQRADDAGFIASLMIDGIATLTVMTPNFFKNINVNDWRELPIEVAMEVAGVYNKVYFPWYMKWMNKMSLS